MCGIAAFLSSTEWKVSRESSFLTEALDRIVAAGADWSKVAASLSALENRFDGLMSFSLFAELVQSQASATHVQRLSSLLNQLLSKATAQIGREGEDPDLTLLVENLRDYAWQLEVEVLGAAAEAARISPARNGRKPTKVHPGETYGQKSPRTRHGITRLRTY